MTAFPASWRAAASRTFLTIALIAMPACGGGGGDSASVELGGAWQGTWESSEPGPSGALGLQLDQQGTTVEGEGIFEGHPCFGNFDVACESKGESLSGWFEAGPNRIAIHMSCMGQHHDRLSGTYQVHAGPCEGDHGSIDLARVAGQAPGAPRADAIRVGEILLIQEGEREVLRVPVFDRAERRP